MGDGLTKKQKKALEELSRGIVNKMLHGPMTALRWHRPRGCQRDAGEHGCSRAHVQPRRAQGGQVSRRFPAGYLARDSDWVRNLPGRTQARHAEARGEESHLVCLLPGLLLCLAPLPGTW